MVEREPHAGGGPQIGRMLDKMGIESRFEGGLRVTDQRTVTSYLAFVRVGTILDVFFHTLGRGRTDTEEVAHTVGQHIECHLRVRRRR